MPMFGNLNIISENKMRWRDKLIRFMYGRYGYDKLSFFMFCAYFAIFIIRTFLAFSSSDVIRVISLVLLFFSFALLALIIFRGARSAS